MPPIYAPSGAKLAASRSICKLRIDAGRHTEMLEASSKT